MSASSSAPVEVVSVSGPAHISASGIDDGSGINKEAQGGLPVNVIAEALSTKDRQIKDMTACTVSLGENGDSKRIHVYDRAGKQYARIPSRYEVTVGAVKATIQSYIYTNIEIPAGGDHAQDPDFNEKIAAAVFFSHEQVKAIFEEEQAAPNEYRGKVNEAIVQLALSNPTFRFSIESGRAEDVRPQPTKEEEQPHYYFNLNVQSSVATSSAAAQTKTARKVHLLVQGADRLVQRMHRATEIPYTEEEVHWKKIDEDPLLQGSSSGPPLSLDQVRAGIERRLEGKSDAEKSVMLRQFLEFAEKQHGELVERYRSLDNAQKVLKDRSGGASSSAAPADVDVTPQIETTKREIETKYRELQSTIQSVIFIARAVGSEALPLDELIGRARQFREEVRNLDVTLPELELSR